MPRQFRIAVLLTSLLMLAGHAALAQSAENAPLQLEAKILLGDVRGRIDHMAIDVKRQRLFVAELGNDSVGVVDLADRRLVRTITGLNEPQGVGYEPSTDTLYVANARDGSIKLFDGNAYEATAWSSAMGMEDWQWSILQAAARSRASR
jgi:DNA-binding beta-propeller fold protein YncE